MKEGRLYVDFNEMLEEDLVPLSTADSIKDSKGQVIYLHEGLTVKIYSDDLGACGEKDNLIAEGSIEVNTHPYPAKWNCRISKAGIYNESQL